MRKVFDTPPCPEDDWCWYCKYLVTRLKYDGIEEKEARRMALVRNHENLPWTC